MKTSRKSMLLFGAVLTVCAFTAPSMASAASWSPVGGAGELVSNDVRFHIIGPLFVRFDATCEASTFPGVVASTSTIKFTAATFQNCIGTGTAAGCTVTATGTQFPWSMTATATSTTNIQLVGINVDVRFETGPSGTCPFPNQSNTVIGTLPGGVWDPSAIGTDRRVTFATAFVGGTQMSASLREPTGVLNLLT